MTGPMTRANAALRRRHGRQRPARHPVPAAAQPRATARFASATSPPRCSSSAPRCSCMLDPPVDAGYVAVARGRDARTRDVSITRAGRAAVAAARAPWKRAQAWKVARKLGGARLETLYATLAELEAALVPLPPRRAGRRRTLVDAAPPAPTGARPPPSLVCGALILMLAMGVRHGFGLFMPQMAVDNGWTRESSRSPSRCRTSCGACSCRSPARPRRPLRRRARARRTAPATCSASSLMAVSQTPLHLRLSAGLLIGLALSGTTFGVVMGVVAKVSRRRSAASRSASSAPGAPSGSSRWCRYGRG